MQEYSFTLFIERRVRWKIFWGKREREKGV